MHSQHATQCTTSANMHSHMGWVFFRKKKSFTKIQIKPKILHGRKLEMSYITGVKGTINPIL